ncbi:hypothetical protein [Vibrio quintilis]|uniref:Uncharacterized protein n=1 Tax=Vibrio quintilis TaxID=1117707 RepID=A0A1M7YZQ7_9VIBR|nr:hypothetical protein [Vibrio quintilis]SHO58053.1 hypothetical protein VQ7734_03823 [Vibrio quintilis]
MKKNIQIILLIISVSWLSLTWLWFAGIPVIPFLFADSNGELGLLFILLLLLVNALVTIIGCIFTYRKKYWWWLVTHLILGGLPAGLYFIGVTGANLGLL